MSSSITLAASEIIARIPTILTAHVRLHDEINIEKNNDNYLKLGWGLRFGQSTNLNLVACDHLTEDRAINIVITREFAAIESDVEAKSNTQVSLLEDAFLIKQDFLLSPTLNNGLRFMKYLGDTGIQQVFGESQRQFLFIELNFTVNLDDGLTI